MILRAEAPAKINRELRVGARRPDGYHAILSRFCSIDLADRLEVESADGFSFSTDGEAAPTDDSNLAVRAAKALAHRLGTMPKARLHVTKRIPVGAGLGGGSADAAATLVLLARLWNARLAPEELSELAAGLGSDVPFFLVGGEVDVAGRGERVQPREDAPSSDVVLLVPPFSVSTAEVYAAYDRLEPGRSRALPERLEVERSGRFFGPNDLAGAVLQTDSRMVNYLRAAEAVASEAAITGTGSAIALSGTSGELRRLADRYPEVRLFACRTLGREEYRRKTNPSGGTTWT
jgi:4-diphosphocytidyl-2-C-methyl-D-erythritol kinase